MLFLLINQLNFDNSEISDIIMHLSSVLDMRQQPIIADDYDLSAQPDASDSESDEDSDDDMPSLISDGEEEEDEEEDQETGPNPESLVFVNGETKFVKDITDHDVNELMSDAEYRAYISLYPASDAESGSESDWLNEDWTKKAKSKNKKIKKHKKINWFFFLTLENKYPNNTIQTHT